MDQRSVFGLIALALSTARCGEELPSPSLVNKLRLLAMTADAPEVLQGTSVTIRARWYDGSPQAGRAVYFHWRLCREAIDRDPRSCLRPDRGSDVNVAPATEHGDVLTLPPERIPWVPGDGQATRYWVLLAICPLEPPFFDGMRGQYVCPQEEAQPASQREGIQAVRRITVRQAPPLNHNPVIARVFIDGQEISRGDGLVRVSACPSGCNNDHNNANCRKVSLEVHAADGSAETQADGSIETLLVSFYVTGGSVDRPRAVASTTSPLGLDGSLATGWCPPSEPGAARVWFVLRDGRGGDAVREVPVLVESR